MSYNLKYCSFYPNNFDASALCLNRKLLSFDLWTASLPYNIG